MNDSDLLALCVLEEAGGEIDDGKAAVARVIHNRMMRKYESDGTVQGTILKPNQFDWAWFAFRGGKYRRVSWTLTQALDLSTHLLTIAPPLALARCSSIAKTVFAGTYHGPLYNNLTDDTVLYLNPHLVSLPDWATPDKFVCTIEHTNFYRA